jgi:hypothetical protein
MSDDEKKTSDVDGYTIPVTWGGQAPPRETESRVVQTASDEELARYAVPQRTCGECKFGDFTDDARAKIRGERFYERLVREEGWQLKHLCSSPEDLGLCGQSDGAMMTGRLHRACDQFRANLGLVKLSSKARS